MDFQLGKSTIDPPSVQQQEVLSGKSMGELINHYCKVNSDLSYYFFTILLIFRQRQIQMMGLADKNRRKTTQVHGLCPLQGERRGYENMTWIPTFTFTITAVQFYLYFTCLLFRLIGQTYKNVFFFLCANQCQTTEWKMKCEICLIQCRMSQKCHWEFFCFSFCVNRKEMVGNLRPSST